MEFFIFRKKKKEEPKADAKQRADQARQSGQNLADQMDAIFCKNTNGKISAERVSTYNQIIHALADNIRHSETLDVEIKEVDAVILNLVGLIRNCVEAGYDALAKEICEKLQSVIKDDRTKSFEPDENQRRANIENRNDKILLIANVLEKKFRIEQNEESVENQRKQLAEKLEEAKGVRKQLEELWNEKPWLKKPSEQFTLSELADPDVQEMDNIKLQLVNLSNTKKAIQQMINDIVAIIVGLKASVDHDELMLANQSMFTNGDWENQINQSTEVFTKQLQQIDETMTKLDEENEKWTTIMTERRTSQRRIDQHIKVDLGFNEMMEEDDLKEEQRRQSMVENTVENTENKILNQ